MEVLERQLMTGGTDDLLSAILWFAFLVFPIDGWTRGKVGRVRVVGWLGRKRWTA